MSSITSAIKQSIRTSIRSSFGGTLDQLQALITSLFSNGEQGAIYVPIPVVNGSQALFQDSAGTVPVTADGDPLGRMLDQSINGNHAIQTISAERILYKEPNSLLQDQVNDRITMTGLNLTPAVGSKTWTFCVSYSDLGTARIILLHESTTNAPWVGIGQEGSSNTTIDGTGITQNKIWFDGVLSTPTTRNDMWLLMVSSSVIVIEFTVLSTSETWDNPTVGAGENPGFYGPKISEFFFLREGVLTEAERKDVELYAANQAGTTL